MNPAPEPRSPAEDELLRRIELSPDDVDGLLRLGVMLWRRRDMAGARDLLLRAHVLRPDSPVIRIYAALALSGCHDDRAAQMLDGWRHWLPLPDQQQFDLALAMQQTDWTAEAIDVLEDVLRRSPAFSWARLLLASIYERSNRLDDAAAMIGPMLSDASTVDAAVRAELLLQHAVLLMRQGDIAAARAKLEQAGPRFSGDVEYHFRLAELADRQQDESAAMLNLARAHEIQLRELERAAPGRLVEDVPIFPQTAHPLEAADVAKWPRLVAPDAQQSPIFVVGFPRSGTTLVEQMLDAHPRLQSMDEWPHFATLADQLEDYGVRVPTDLGKLTQSDCDELRKGYLALSCSRVERRWDSSLVDKNPANMLWLPLIHRMFPRARFILLLRHPCDVILSNYMQDYRSAVMMAASVTLQKLVRAYVEAFEYWLHHVALLQPAVLEVRYEELVADPGTQAARLATWLELEDADSMLRVAQHARDKGFIGTPSYTRVIEPIDSRAVGRWRRYRRWLDEPLRTLAPVAVRLGYDDAS